MRSVYFDFNSTTPLDSSVWEKMKPYYEDIFGNPSSVHHLGRRARAALDESRERVAAVFQCKPSEIIFTSGGTESNNLALFGAAKARAHQGRHIISSAIEHPAVLHACRYLAAKEGFDVTYLAPDEHGFITPDDLTRAFRSDTILVSVMAANNEIGALQPFASMGALCRERGILFHTDAVQWFGKQPFDRIDTLNADLVSFCAHKCHGPKGAGLLYCRSPLLIDPILFGGAHENERRAGTENLPAIVGLAECVERFLVNPVFPANNLMPLTLQVIDGVASIDAVTLRSPRGNRLANTVSFTVEGCDSISLLAGLDMEGFCASSGSACSSGSLEPSHVLLAMGVPSHLANSFVRFSLGRSSTIEEVTQLLDALPAVIGRIRAVQ